MLNKRTAPEDPSSSGLWGDWRDIMGSSIDKFKLCKFLKTGPIFEKTVQSFEISLSLSDYR